MATESIHYNASTLRELIKGAQALGFQDDVDYFSAELAKLEAKEPTDG